MFVFTARLIDRTVCAITTQQQNCQFLIPERIMKNVASGFALQTLVVIFTILFPCMDINTFVFLTLPVRTLNFSKNIFSWFLDLFRKINPLVTHQEKRMGSFSKRKLAEITPERASRTLIVASAEKLKKHFCASNFPRAHFVRTINVRN